MKNIIHKLRKKWSAYVMQKQIKLLEQDHYDKIMLLKNINTLVSDALISIKKLQPIAIKIKIGSELGLSLKDVLQKYGNTLIRFKKTPLQDHSIYFYRHTIGVYTAHCQIHLFKNKVFWIRYEFPHLSDSDKAKLIAILAEKYGCSMFDYKEFSLVDESQNTIWVEESVSFSIHYLSVNSPFFETFNMHQKQTLQKEHRKQVYQDRKLRDML